MRSLKGMAIMVILLCAINIFQVSAMDSKFESNPVENEKKQNILSRIQLEKVEYESTSRAEVCAIDVSKTNQVAVALTNKEINIYDENGHFLYGFTFKTDGSYNIEYDDQDSNLIIFFVRGDLLLKVDSNGNVLELNMATNSIANNDYYTQLLNRHKIVSDNAVYTMESVIGLSDTFRMGYTKVIVSTADGTKNIVYDSSTYFFWKLIVLCLLISTFIIIVVLIIVKQWRRNMKRIRSYDLLPSNQPNCL